MERALLGSLLGETPSLPRWVHGWSLVHHLQPRYTSNLQLSFFHNRSIYIGNLLATLLGGAETYAKAAQKKSTTSGCMRCKSHATESFRSRFKPAGRPHLGQGGVSIRHGVTIVLVAFVVLFETIRTLQCG
jgi:hypothetical protein